MDRVIVYPNEIPQDVHITQGEKNAYVGQGKFAAAVLGANAQILFGFACTPTSPAGMTVNVAPGDVYSQQFIDPTAYGSLSADTVNQIVKQGSIYSITNCSCPAPSTVGDSINYLIEIGFLEQDIGSTVLPYFNPTNINSPYSGPNNTGVAQNTNRNDYIQLQVKAGVQAPTGTQTTPSPDTGYIGAWVVTVAYGATTIISNNISQYSSASFIQETLIQKISQATADVRYAQIAAVQSGIYLSGTDSGTANAYVTTISPALTAYTSGMNLRVKIGVGNTNTGASTVNANGLGAKNITLANGSAINPGDIPAGMIADFFYDGTNFQLLNPASFLSPAGSYGADTGAANAYVAALNPAASSYFAGLTFRVKIAHTNTSASCTLNLNSLGTKNIKLANGSNPSLGDLLIGMIAEFTYDGINLQLINPATLTTLANFASQLTTNGYQKLPSGLILQWGKPNISTGNGDVVTFPISFPNAILNITASDWGPGAHSMGWSSNASLSNFLAYGRDVTSGGAPYALTAYSYLAIGY